MQTLTLPDRLDFPPDRGVDPSFIIMDRGSEPSKSVLTLRGSPILRGSPAGEALTAGEAFAAGLPLGGVPAPFLSAFFTSVTCRENHHVSCDDKYKKNSLLKFYSVSLVEHQFLSKWDLLKFHPPEMGFRRICEYKNFNLDTFISNQSVQVPFLNSNLSKWEKMDRAQGRGA